jgi:DNA repair protein RadC
MKVYNLEYKFSVVEEVEGEALTSTRGYLNYLRSAFDDLPMQEQVWVLCLNVHHVPVCRRRITIGVVDCVQFHMRELYAPALSPNVNASYIVVAHNHPSGSTVPSDADYKATEAFKKAGQAIGVPCIEHLVIGDPKSCPKGLGYFSFATNGYLKDDFKPEVLTLK